MAALNALIAQGGTGGTSPINRYLQTRQFMNQERRNALAESQTKQQMGVTAQNQQMAQKEQATKSLAALGQYLDTIPVEQRSQAFEAAKPKFGEYGLPPMPEGMTYEQVAPGIEKAKLQIYGTPEGKPVNVTYGGKVISAIDDGSGNYLDERTRKPLYGAVKAPTKQITGTPDQMSGDFEGKAKRDKDREGAVAERENLFAVAGNIRSIKDTMTSATDYVGGVSGSVVNAVNSASEQWRQIHGGEDPVMTGGVIDIKKLKDGSGKLNKENLDWLRRSAMSNSAVDSATLELAFTHAKLLNNSGKISDADVRFAREIIEGGSDMAIKQQKLDGMLDRAHIGYQAKRQAREGMDSYQWWSPVSKDELYGKYAPTAMGGGGAGGVNPEVDSAAGEALKDMGIDF